MSIARKHPRPFRAATVRERTDFSMEWVIWRKPARYGFMWHFAQLLFDSKAAPSA